MKQVTNEEYVYMLFKEIYNLNSGIESTNLSRVQKIVIDDVIFYTSISFVMYLTRDIHKNDSYKYTEILANAFIKYYKLELGIREDYSLKIFDQCINYYTDAIAFFEECSKNNKLDFSDINKVGMLFLQFALKKSPKYIVIMDESVSNLISSSIFNYYKDVINKVIGTYLIISKKYTIK